jgi:hypothetical protein
MSLLPTYVEARFKAHYTILAFNGIFTRGSRGRTLLEVKHER